MNILFKINNNNCESVILDAVNIVPEIITSLNGTIDLPIDELLIIKKFYSYIGINKFFINGEWEYLYKNREICETFIHLLNGNVSNPEKLIKYYYSTISKLHKIKNNTILLDKDIVQPYKNFVIGLDKIIDKIDLIYNLNINKSPEIMFHIKYIVSKSLQIYKNLSSSNDKINYIISEVEMIENKCKNNYSTLLIILSNMTDTVIDNIKLSVESSHKAFTYMLDFLDKINNICLDYQVILISIQLLFIVFYIKKRDNKPYIYDYNFGTLISQYTRSINYVFYELLDYSVKTLKLFNNFERNVVIYQDKKDLLVNQLVQEKKIFVPTNLFYYTYKSLPNKKFHLKKITNKEIDITCSHCLKYIHYNEVYYSDMEDSLLLNLMPVHMCSCCTLRKSFRVMCNKKDIYGKNMFIKTRGDLKIIVDLFIEMEKKSPVLVKEFNNNQKYSLKLLDRKNTIQFKNLDYKK